MNEYAGMGRGNEETPLEIAERAVEQARPLKADVEAYAQAGRTVTIKVFQGDVESATVAEPRGVGIRAVRDGRTGYAFSTDVSPEGTSRAVAEIMRALEAADNDRYAGLPEGGDYEAIGDLWSAGVVDTSIEQKTALALQAEEIALAVDGVVAVEESVYTDEEEHVAVCSSRGVRAESRTSYGFVYVVAHAGQGTERQSGLGFDAGRDPGKLDPRQAGLEAAAKANALVGGRQCKTGSYTVVLDGLVVSALLSTVVRALSADAVLKGRSVFGGELGKVIASDRLSLVDDGLDPRGMATSPFDGEGVPQQRTVVIEEGVLCTYLYDTRSARWQGGGAGSTGNARRASYRSLPGVGSSNLVVAEGEGTLEEVIRRVGDGLYVGSVAGVHSGVNPVSGEISLGVTGNLISKGRMGTPVREVTMATDFRALLAGVCDVGGDTRWIPLYGSVCTPCVVVEGVAVSGA